MLSGVFGGVAFAGGANHAASSACKKSGWQTLTGVGHGAFKNQGDCVSFALQGGQFGSGGSNGDGTGDL